MLDIRIATFSEKQSTLEFLIINRDWYKNIIKQTQKLKNTNCITVIRIYTFI